MRKLTVALALGCVGAGSLAAATPDVIDLGSNGDRVAAASNDVQRVGSAGLVIVFSKKNDSPILEVDQLVIGCDSDSVSAPIRSTVVAMPRLELPETRSEVKSALSVPSVKRLELRPWAASSLPYANALRQQKRALCSGAREPDRDLTIPIGATDAYGGESALSSYISFLPTSVSRVGRVLEAWIRVDAFRDEALSGEGFVPAFLKDVKVPKPTGAHTLARMSFDCDRRTYSRSLIVRYDQAGKLIQSDDVRATPFSPAVPGSIAEAELDLLCFLYN